MDGTNPTLKPYPAYKDSGVPWLGEIPAHWSQRPLKHWVTINKQTLPETTPADYAFKYLDIGSVETGYLVRQPENLCFKDAPSRARRILTKGDTIISTVRTYLKAVYFVNKDEANLVASTGFAVLTPRSDLDPSFLSYLIRSNSFIDRVTANSVGIAYPAITETVMGAFHVAVPASIDEQHHIAAFLDHIDRRVNRFIRIKRRMIALLNEQKQAIIHRAVTRGLDPDVRLKPSGVEWMGEVPEHWEVRRAKYLFREVDHRSTTGSEVLLSLRMHQGLVPHNEVSQIPIGSDNLVGFKKVQPGQVVMNRMRAAIGLFGVASLSGLVSPDYAIFESLQPLIPEYFLCLFKTRAMGTVFRLESKGLGTGSSGFMRLYTDRFGRIGLLFPPIEEQVAIVQGIAQKTRELDQSITRIQREISLIREYRTRLIADVVTGKLDVRGVDLAAYGDELAGLDEALVDEEETDEDEAGEDEMV